MNGPNESFWADESAAELLIKGGAGRRCQDRGEILAFDDHFANTISNRGERVPVLEQVRSRRQRSMPGDDARSGTGDRESSIGCGDHAIDPTSARKIDEWVGA